MTWVVDGRVNTSCTTHTWKILVINHPAGTRLGGLERFYVYFMGLGHSYETQQSLCRCTLSQAGYRRATTFCSLATMQPHWNAHLFVVTRNFVTNLLQSAVESWGTTGEGNSVKGGGGRKFTLTQIYALRSGSRLPAAHKHNRKHVRLLCITDIYQMKREATFLFLTHWSVIKIRAKCHHLDTPS